MKQENDIRLKRGWTTGACATAAAKAGLYALWSGEKLDVVSITLPKGEQPLFRISFFEQKINSVEVGIIKDAGDDPDVTCFCAPSSSGPAHRTFLDTCRHTVLAIDCWPVRRD